MIDVESGNGRRDDRPPAELFDILDESADGMRLRLAMAIEKDEHLTPGVTGSEILCRGGAETLPTFADSASIIDET